MYCRFLFEDVEVVGLEAEEEAREVGLGLGCVVDIVKG